MKIVLIIIFCIISIQIFADCLSCWELFNVAITLNNDEIIQGYITWNDSWINDSKIRKLSIYEKFNYKLLNNDRFKLILYNKIVVLEDHLPCNGVVSSTSIDTLSLDDFSNIEILPTQKKRYNGTGKILSLDNESIELLKNKPFNYIFDGGQFADVFYLNYNSNISLEALHEMAEDKEFWIKRKFYEKMKVIGLMFSWD